MQLSDRGLRMICGFEGFVPTVYMDRAGVPTIGYGHALTHEEVTAGTFYKRKLTEQEALELCRKDIHRFEVAVSELVRVPVTQAQWDALISFSYNVGVAALKSSTLLAKLNAGNYVGAASEFVNWDHIGKREDMGLKGRREGEARLFLEGMASVGGPTLDDVLRLAEAQQFDLAADIGLADPQTRETDPAPPMPDDPRNEVTRPDVAALPPKDEEPA